MTRLEALRIAAARQAMRAKVPTLDGECWRTPPGFSRYEVSNQGRVRGPSGLCRPFRKKRQTVVKLVRDDGMRDAYELGRLMLQTFGVQVARYGIIRHRDGNPQNFRLDNLVCSARRAHLDAAEGAVLEALRLGKTQKEAAAQLGLSPWMVRRIVRKARRHGEELGTKPRRRPITPEERAEVIEALRAGASYAQAAEHAQVSLATVHRILHRARQDGEPLAVRRPRHVHQAVLEALASGASRRDVASATGISMRTIHRIVVSAKECA